MSHEFHPTVPDHRNGDTIAVRIAVADYQRLPIDVRALVHDCMTMRTGIPVGGELVLSMPVYRWVRIRDAMRALPVGQ
jgi:hypothetical protein